LGILKERRCTWGTSKNAKSPGGKRELQVQEKNTDIMRRVRTDQEGPEKEGGGIEIARRRNLLLGPLGHGERFYARRTRNGPGLYNLRPEREGSKAFSDAVE